MLFGIGVWFLANHSSRVLKGRVPRVHSKLIFRKTGRFVFPLSMAMPNETSGRLSAKEFRDALP
jgi:hypothetical protein